MRRSQWPVLLLGASALFVLQACTSLTASEEDEENDDEAVAALVCMSMFQGAEYQNLVAQFEAQEAEAARSASVKSGDEEDDAPPRLFLGEETQSCYLNDEKCRADGNRLCKIIAEGRIFGLPIDGGGGGAIDPSTAALAAAGAAAAAAVVVGVAVTVAGGSSSTVNTTD